MTSNHHALYALGYTRATMAGTKGSEIVILSKPQKKSPSSDCTLQLEYMKSELLVIADQNAAVRVRNAYAIYLLQGNSPEKFGLMPHSIVYSHE